MRLSSSSAGFSLSFAVTIVAAVFSTVSAAPSSTPTEDGRATPVLRLDLMKRNSADDATDPAKVLAWLKDNIDLEPDRAVFYSDKNIGQAMARHFCDQHEEDGYKYFYSIFDQNFSDAFGGADPSADIEIAKACSEAFAKFATGEVRIFNDAGASSTSFWKTIELPGLKHNKEVSKIWNMADNTDDPNNHDKDLKHAASGLAYLPGYCGVHVTQYQKNEGPAAANGGVGTSNYRFDITIFDEIQVQVGQVLLANAPGGVGVGVTSALPWVLIVTALNVDEDPVRFAYAGSAWDSNSPQCSVGKYDSGSRNMDCGFPCPAPSGSSMDLKKKKRLRARV